MADADRPVPPTGRAHQAPPARRAERGGAHAAPQVQAAGAAGAEAAGVATAAAAQAGRGAEQDAGAGDTDRCGDSCRAGGGAAAAPEAKGGEASLAGFVAWTFGDLPELLELRVAGRDVVGFPALHDDGDSVSLRPFDTPEEAMRVHRRGLARLFALALKDQVRAVERLPDLRALALAFIPFGTDAELKAQIVAATLMQVCLLDPLPGGAEAFACRCAEAKPRVTLVAQEFIRLAGRLIGEHAAVQKRLAGLKMFPDVLADIQAQLGALMSKRFLLDHPWQRLAHFNRYIKAAGVRIDKLRNNPARDAQLLAEWRSLAQPFERELAARRKAGVVYAELEEFRWLLEELRVGLFAQELKTPMPISVKRLQKIWDSRPR